MGTIKQPFQYNGRDGVATDANGLYHMRARYYNPEIKRFINRDVLTGSISDSQTLNRYAYVIGNPISYVDPFGLSRDGDSAWLQGGSFLADLVPWVGTVKGFQQAFTGNNYITGEHLSAGDRWGEGIGATLSIIRIPGLKHAGKYGTKGVIWAGSKLKKVVTESAVATPLKSKFSLKLNLQLFGGAGKPEDTIDLFRAVGPDEFYDIMDNRLFRPGPYSFDGKQLGYNFDEVLKLTDFLKDSSAIIKVKLLKSVIDELDHTPVDKMILKSGSVTIQLEKYGIFNQSILEIIHEY